MSDKDVKEKDVKKDKNDIDKNNSRYRDYLMKKAAVVKIVAFSVMLLIGAIVSLIIPLRPSVSVSESRTLTKFPKFSFESFLDGEYFSTVDKWFSDTFPFRDQLLMCNDKVNSLYGVRGTVVHGEIVAGDDIPDVNIDVDDILKPATKPEKETSSTGQSQVSTESGSADKESSGEGNQDKESLGETSTGQEQTTQESTQNQTGTGETESNKESPTGSIVVGETFGSVFVYGDSAHEYYAFSQSYSDQYVDIVNNLAGAVSDKASFYSVIIPTSMDIMLQDDIRSSLTSSDQRKAILYMYSKMGSNVNKTFIFDVLRSHRDEYLYFRSDHHWTALAAYYTYCTLASQMGITPNSIDSYKKMEFTNFQGSFYTNTKEASLIANPDKVIAYVPMATNSLVYTKTNGQKVNYNIIANVSDFQPRNKYSTFIAGDNPYTEIKNPKLNDGSSCVVIKESFGNAFVPFLVDHFQYVYVIDYRYYKGTVSELVKEKNISNVIMLNNVAATSTSWRINEMKKVCK